MSTIPRAPDAIAAGSKPASAAVFVRRGVQVLAQARLRELWRSGGADRDHASAIGLAAGVALFRFRAGVIPTILVCGLAGMLYPSGMRLLLG
jgi:hypothetical protein